MSALALFLPPPLLFLLFGGYMLRSDLDVRKTIRGFIVKPVLWSLLLCAMGGVVTVIAFPFGAAFLYFYGVIGLCLAALADVLLLAGLVLKAKGKAYRGLQRWAVAIGTFGLLPAASLSVLAALVPNP